MILTKATWLLPGMAMFYPLELTRLRLMADVGPEPKLTGGFSFINELMKISYKEAWHGIGPYLANHSLSFTLFAAIGIYLHPYLAPLGTFAAYPLNTVWARIAIEAGREQKKFKSAMDCLFYIMDNEKP